MVDKVSVEDVGGAHAHSTRLEVDTVGKELEGVGEASTSREDHQDSTVLGSFWAIGKRHQVQMADRLRSKILQKERKRASGSIPRVKRSGGVTREKVKRVQACSSESVATVAAFVDGIARKMEVKRAAHVMMAEEFIMAIGIEKFWEILTIYGEVIMGCQCSQATKHYHVLVHLKEGKKFSSLTKRFNREKQIINFKDETIKRVSNSSKMKNLNHMVTTCIYLRSMYNKTTRKHVHYNFNPVEPTLSTYKEKIACLPKVYQEFNQDGFYDEAIQQRLQYICLSNKRCALMRRIKKEGRHPQITAQIKELDKAMSLV